MEDKCGAGTVSMRAICHILSIIPYLDAGNIKLQMYKSRTQPIWKQVSIIKSIDIKFGQLNIREIPHNDNHGLSF